MQFFRHLTDPALKRLYKFVLKRMIGRFLAADELDLDQLDVHLRAGKLELCDLLLNADVLNAEICEANALPFRVKKGYLGSVRVTISYANIMSESCLVEIDDIEVVLVPIDADEEEDSAFHQDTDQSGAKSATQMSTTGAKQGDSAPIKSKSATTATTKEPVNEISQEGLDFVASWIDQVTSKIKVTLSNICLRLETGDKHRTDRNASLLCKLEWAQFTDESAVEVQSVYGRANLDHSSGMFGSQTAGGGMSSIAASSLFGISQKGIKFRGISMELELGCDEEIKQDTGDEGSDMILHPILASDPTRQCYVQVKMSHYEMIEAPMLDADVFLHSIRVVLQPQHFPELGGLIDAFSAEPHNKIHRADGRITAASMYLSVCDTKPTWLNEDNTDDDGTIEGGALSLSYKEFQRIEQLLMQYRQTHEELRNVQRQTLQQSAAQAPDESNLAMSRAFSMAESVDSVGLSDLDDEESFFDCDTGSSMVADSNHYGSNLMSQSIYTSAIYDHGDSDAESNADARSIGSRSTTAAQSRASRQVRHRVKVHLLECDLVLLYDDIPDEEYNDGADDGDREVQSKSVSLPSTDGQERLEIACKDIICSCLVYPHYAALALTIGTFRIDEKMLPRMSMDVVEEESALLSNSILMFADTSPSTGRKVHSSANISAQLRLNFKPDEEQQSIESLSLRLTAQPILFEWDMHILDRAHRLMKLLEESSVKQAASKSTRNDMVTEYPKLLEVTTECIQVALRFPMVNSDVIRFGNSSKRGLCEDKLVITLDMVTIGSTSPPTGSEVDKTDDEQDNNLTKIPLPWLSEFDVRFNNAKVVLVTPENGLQRSSRLKETILITAKTDVAAMKDCRLNLRLQSPSRDDIRTAIASKQNMSQDSTQHPDAVSPGSPMSGDDNDGGRVGVNGWNLSAIERAERFERAAANSSLFALDISIPIANARFMKSSLDRLMILFDALLMINPIDVNAYNQMIATAVGRNRLIPSYMSLNLTLNEGVIKICDHVVVSPGQSSGSNVHIEGDADCSEKKKVLFSYHFAFQELKVFQISQWMGQLVSRVHVSAQNMTLLEEDDDSKQIVPIIYKTPFGVSSAPIVFAGIDIIDQTQEMREMKVELHFSHVSLRYDVTSKWMFQLIDILLMEYPAPIIPLDSMAMSAVESDQIIQSVKEGTYEVVKLAVPSKTVFTKLFINLYDALVDYAPPALESRVIVVVGNIGVSSNVVSGALMQGYQISAKDLQVHLTHSRTSYDEIDDCVLGKEMYMKTKRPGKKDLSFARGTTGVVQSTYPSLLMFLEKSGYLQIITMDFMDVFLRSVVPTDNDKLTRRVEEKTPVSSFPDLSVELNLGTANIYACFDSFNTLVELLSAWADQLAIKQEPHDTTAYVGLDRVNDTSSVSVVTNLSSATTNNRGFGTSVGSTSTSQSPGAIIGANKPALTSNLSDRAGFSRDFSSSRASLSEKSDISGHYGSTESNISILEQIDEMAFGGGKHIFPGKHVATDTEARLLRTRLDEIQKQKDRLVSGIQRDDEMSGPELKIKYKLEEKKPKIRINELMIEDYYAENGSTRGSVFGTNDSTAGDFLMGPKAQAQEEEEEENPWFIGLSNAAPHLREDVHPLGSLPDEQAARWLSPSQIPVGGMHDDVNSTVSSPRFEPIEEKAPVPREMHTSLHEVSLDGLRCEENADDEENDEFDPDRFPVGAFPATSKHWWGMQEMHPDVELSELQTEETESAFSRRMDFFDDDEMLLGDASECDQENANPMSMSMIGIGEDQGTEVELDFALDGELQSKFNRLMDLESSDDRDQEAMLEEELESLHSEFESSQLNQRELRRTTSSPRSIPRKASFLSTTNSQAPSFSPSLLSPPDEPTARWFYDDVGEDGSVRMGPPSRIYPHHIEVPIGGAAASLSFGEKESDDAVRSIARENATRKIDGTAPVVVTHVLLRNFSICMRFFGGSDWTRDGKQATNSLHPLENSAGGRTKASSVDESRSAKKEKLLDALLDNYVPSNGEDLFGGDNSSTSTLFSGAQSAPATSASFIDRQKLSGQPSRKRSLKSGRKTEEMLELMVTRIQMRLDVFNEDESQPLASSTVLALGDFEILDYISTSQIRKIICYWKSDVTHPRESGSSMVHVHLMTVRPGPNLCDEHRLKVRMLPLRINLDQEVVNFLRQFVPAEDPTIRRNRPQVSSAPGDDETKISHGIEGTEMKMLNQPSRVQETDVSLGGWFFQSIDIRPCKIKIDYRPNHVDYAALRAGDYLEVINLFVLENMELVLRRVKMSGIDGWAALAEQVLMSWVNDISRHQIHKCLASVSMPPLRPFANIGSGAADLILLPMEHYGKDRRLVRGLKKGAKSFLKSVTIETLNTASKVAQGTQALLEHADDVVSSSSALRKKQIKYRQAGSRIQRNSRSMGGGGIRSAQDSGGGIGGRQYLTQQPSNATEGLYQAYDSLSRELHVAAKTIVAVPLVEYKKTGSQGYVRSVIRAVPVAVLRPMIGATEAMSKALIGVRNAVDPELKEDIENKFKDFRAY